MPSEVRSFEHTGEDAGVWSSLRDRQALFVHAFNECDIDISCFNFLCLHIERSFQFNFHGVIHSCRTNLTASRWIKQTQPMRAQS